MACPRCVPGRATSLPAAGRAALFLDRDGVINADAGYTHRQDDFHFMPGIFDLAREASSRGLSVVVVTNQAGIGRGLYDDAAFATLTDWMLDRFLAEGVAIDRVYYCPHHPEAVTPSLRLDCPCRKPAPGMFLAARDDLQIDLGRSLMVGDKASDLQAAASAGVGVLALLGDEALTPDLRHAQRAGDLATVSKLIFGG